MKLAYLSLAAGALCGLFASGLTLEAQEDPAPRTVGEVQRSRQGLLREYAQASPERKKEIVEELRGLRAQAKPREERRPAGGDGVKLIEVERLPTPRPLERLRPPPELRRIPPPRLNLKPLKELRWHDPRGWKLPEPLPWIPVEPARPFHTPR